MAGTLVTTDAPTPSPVVVLVSGSGPIDRDSNMKRLPIGVMAQVADYLADNGIASFRYDKRGVGASTGDYASTGFYDNVADAAAAIEMLRANDDVDAECIFVVGHSEGALIAAELAATDPRLAGVVLLAGTATPGEEVLHWQAKHVSASLPGPVKLLLRILRQDVARSQRKRLAQIKATTGDTTRVQLVKINAKWLREFMAHDPAPSLESIDVPVLALTGSKDIQVNPADVQRTCQLVGEGCTGHVLDDLTHLLRSEAGPPTLRTYKKQAKRPVNAGMLAAVTEWLREQTTRTANGDRSMNSYEDTGIVLDEVGITINNYIYPGHRRTIPYTSIHDHEVIELGALTGRHRLVGFGCRRPRHFFHWDRKRGSKKQSVALDVGRFVRPVISPERTDELLRSLEKQTLAN